MPRLVILLINLVGIVLAAGAGFVGLSERVFPFTESLRQEEADVATNGSRSSVSLRFHNDDDTVSAATEVSIDVVGNGLYGLRVSTSHSEDTRLDAVRLTIRAGQPSLPIALRTPGGSPWNPVHFQKTDDGQGAIVDVPDLGIQGNGTVSLEFVVGPYFSDEELPESIWLNFNARIHREGGLQITDYKADTLVEVPMPSRASGRELR